MIFRKFICILIVCCRFDPSTESRTQSKIKVEGNGYTGLSVAISSNVEEDINLIDKIKSRERRKNGGEQVNVDMTETKKVLLETHDGRPDLFGLETGFGSKNKNAFTEGSRLLYKATGYRLFFKEIDIYIPKEWSRMDIYENVIGTRFENFPIRIDVPSSLSSAPFVWGLPYCGGLGQYMHLTPQLLANYQTRYGSHDRIIVHEWGHLRFGVFDEYPTIRQDKLHLKRFYNKDGTWKPVRCTDEIQGFMSTNCRDKSKTCKLSATGQPELACRFCIDRAATKAKASLMGSQWLPTLEEFCDTDDQNTPPVKRHTSDSINKQTQYCDGQSIWEIMRQHSDIKEATPGSPGLNTDPTFRLFQEQTDLVVVLVLDVSGSMSREPLRKLREAAATYLLNTASNGTSIGIVIFRNVAFISHTLTQITSKTTRNSLVNALPTSARGATSIGAGLQKGYEMILAHSSESSGSTLLLVTDGNENASPYIRDIEPDLIAKGIKVDTLAYGASADPGLENLAMATGGNSYFYTGFENSSGINDVFDNLVATKDNYLQIHSSTIVVGLGVDENIAFYVDPNTGRDIKVRLSLSTTNAEVMVLIQTPSGKVFNSSEGSNNNVPSIELKGENEPGEYLIQISTDSSVAVSGTILVTSKRKNSSSTDEPVEITGWLSDYIFHIPSMKKISVHASVLKGYAPVVYGNASARIEDGNGNYIDLTLNDDGIGSDLEANDGVYSASILSTRIKTSGRHFIKITASNLEGKAKLLVRDEEQSDDFEIVLKEQDVEQFQREKVIEGFSVNSTTNQVNANDTIPPSRISTLSIQRYSAVSQTFIIEWKAPGDDYEYGQVLEYDIRIAESSQGLRNDPDSEQRLVMTSKPKMAGEIETFLIQPNKSDENTTYYIGIRGIDDSNNYGKMSNILSISVITDSEWLRDSETDEQSDGLSTLNIIIIAVAIILFVLIVVVISCNVTCQGRTKQSSKQTKGFKNNAFEP